MPVLEKTKAIFNVNNQIENRLNLSCFRPKSRANIGLILASYNEGLFRKYK